MTSPPDPAGAARPGVMPPVEIRPEEPGDHAAIRRVVADAFGADDVADLVEAIRASPEYTAELALVATLDGEVVGHVMVSGATLRDGEVDRPIAILSPLAVAPSRQQRGIGGALVRAVVARADAAGEPMVVLEGDPGYYPQFGFEPAGPLGIRLPLPDWAPPEAGQVRRLTRFDPALRGVVIYPPAFDALE